MLPDRPLVILVGNLGADPESRSLQSGSKVVNLRIATSESWNDRGSGERKERTEWHRVVIYNERLGEVAEKYLKKGAKVYLEGALETRKWTDQSGQEKFTTEVVLRNFRGELTMLDGRSDGGGMSEGGGYRSAAPRTERAPRAGTPAPASTGASWDSGRGGGDLDDEIPF
jgi:single-strand DNA-binding protein